MKLEELSLSDWRLEAEARLARVTQRPHDNKGEGEIKTDAEDEIKTDAEHEIKTEVRTDAEDENTPETKPKNQKQRKLLGPKENRFLLFSIFPCEFIVYLTLSFLGNLPNFSLHHF